MAEEQNEEVPTEEVPVVEKVAMSKIRQSQELYTAEGVDAVVHLETVRAGARESEIESKITEHVVTAHQEVEAARAEASEALAEATQRIDTQIAQMEGSGLRYKGVLTNLSDLNSVTEKSHGDMYVIQTTGRAYIWTVPPQVGGTASWVEMSGAIDLSNYYTKDQTYSKEQIDVIAARADNNKQAVDRAIAAFSMLAGTYELVDDEYDMEMIKNLVNLLLRTLKAAFNVEPNS